MRLTTGGGKTLLAFEGLMPIAEADARMHNMEVGFFTVQSNLDAQAQLEWRSLRKVGSQLEFDTYEGLKSKIAEAKMEFGRRLQSGLHRRSQKLKDEILDALNNHTRGVRLREVMDDRMILNAAFLLDRGAQDSFSARVQAFMASFRGEVEFRKAGPLPPYSFFLVDIKKSDPLLLEEGRRLFGLSEGATSLEVQRSYQTLAREQHPDRHPGDPEATPRFERMTAAYRALLEHGRQEIHVTVSGLTRTGEPSVR
jgi:hypothetical protein